MRNIFPGYYQPTEGEFSILWNEGIFVFDTNVLLNLYSYPEDVRNVFLSVLSKVTDRIWIPYQVGLEFHRNRFTRIKQANQRVEQLLQTINKTGSQINSEVNSIELEKRNIGISDIQDRLTAVQAAHTALSEAVQLACNKLPPISLSDSIGTKICELLDGRVGSPPEDQAALDELVADGQDRFDKQIPPGFLDAKNKGESTFRDRGLTYFRKFGDLIIWKQLISHARDQNIKNVIFVTGDKKPDWWWLDEPRTLGPLPELVQEIILKAGVERFWMYSADQFLKYAETYLKAAEVTAEAIEQVKEFSAPTMELAPSPSSPPGSTLLTGADVSSSSTVFERWLNESDTSTALSMGKDNFHHFQDNRRVSLTRDFLSENAVEIWIQLQHPYSKITKTKTFPDFIVEHKGNLFGYEFKFISNFSARAFPPSIVNTLLRGYLEIHESRLQGFTLLIGLPPDYDEYFNDMEWRKETIDRSLALLSKYPAGSIIFGTVFGDNFSEIIRIQW
ncbi:PIN-like domain-containing protein (plasmid) [Chromobacterium amazonense]|uniref:PIN-like domain-containing protein n=1 Tax=Chromobacterium amazonense TaxID=1382803 RepID=UPI00237DEAF6|nr:PIN-like domain-containing protein [Chromobacterium amazonense]MDE1712993.1 PIN-like domain-containing protein [Chromobacterium amazonense]